MVPPRGIEPRSSVLQTGAMTTSAKAALFGVTNRYRSGTTCFTDKCAGHYTIVTIVWQGVLDSNQ